MVQKNIVLVRIEANYKKLSKMQKRIADYLLHEYKSALFLTCSELAKNSGVSEATVVRFANEIGYSGFTEMITELQNCIRKEISVSDRYNLNTKYFSNHSNIFKKLIDRNINAINKMGENVNDAKIDNIVKNMRQCSNIIIVGSESSSSITQYAEYFFSRLGIDIININNESIDLYKIYKSIDEDTLVFNIGLPRYPKKQLEITEILNKMKCKMVVFTDSKLSPFYEYGDECLLFPVSVSTGENYEAHVCIIIIIQVIITKYVINSEENDKKQLLDILEKYNELFQIF